MSPLAPLPKITLVLGGARSGKSRYAEELIAERGRGLYLATAEPLDGEMAERIDRHRSRRGSSWDLVEEPLDIAGVTVREARGDRPILVDCLTLWVSNLMHAGTDPLDATPALLAAAQASTGPLVFVSNEVGLGIVPDNPMARAFRDAAGLVNQSVAQIADRVVFVAAGLPMVLKGNAE